MSNTNSKHKISTLTAEIATKKLEIEKLKFDDIVKDVEDNYINKLFSYDKMSFTYFYVEEYSVKGYLGNVILSGLMVTCNSLDTDDFTVRAGSSSLIPNAKIPYDNRVSLNKVFDFGIKDFEQMVKKCIDNTNEAMAKYTKEYNITKLANKL